MTFPQYCLSKKIDPDQFRLKEPTIWQEWESMYNQLSPASFTEQKKFLINKIRRRFLLVAQEAEKKQ